MEIEAVLISSNSGTELAVFFIMNPDFFRGMRNPDSYCIWLNYLAAFTEIESSLALCRELYLFCITTLTMFLADFRQLKPFSIGRTRSSQSPN